MSGYQIGLGLAAAVAIAIVGCAPEHQRSDDPLGSSDDGGAAEPVAFDLNIDGPARVREQAATGLPTPRRDYVATPDLGHEGRAITGGANDVSGNTISQSRRDATVSVQGGCSGTLVTPRIVLTAAHCVDGFSPTQVQFGATFPRTSFGTVVACYMHPRFDGNGDALPPAGALQEFDPCNSGEVDWDSKRSKYDIAVLVLQERVELGLAGVFPVIPARINTVSQSPGTSITIAGWGFLDPGETVVTDVRQRIATSIENYFDELTPKMGGAMFAGGDLTQGGDSGGSYMIGNPETGPLQLVGVVSGSYEADCGSDFCWVVPNRSWAAPLRADPGNGTFQNDVWLAQFHDEILNSPGAFSATLYAGDWDLPLSGSPGRATANPTLLAQDLDGDGLVDSHDNCPTIRNPEQRDSSPTSPNVTGVTTSVDVALDGVANFSDCLGRILVGAGAI